MAQYISYGPGRGFCIHDLRTVSHPRDKFSAYFASNGVMVDCERIDLRTGRSFAVKCPSDLWDRLEKRGRPYVAS